MQSMEDFTYRLTSFFGFFLLSGMAWATGSRAKVNTKTILGCFFLAWVLGSLTFWLAGSRSNIQWINDFLISILSASHKGAVFLFGPLALSPGQAMLDGTPSIGFVLAFQ